MLIARLLKQILNFFRREPLDIGTIRLLAVITKPNILGKLCFALIEKVALNLN